MISPEFFFAISILIKLFSTRRISRIHFFSTDFLSRWTTRESFKESHLWRVLHVTFGTTSCKDDTFPNSQECKVKYTIDFFLSLPSLTLAGCPSGTWGVRFFCKIHFRLILTTENKHDNGNSNIWRCISYWKMRISQCDMSFQGLYPNKTGVVSGANWNLEEPFWIQQEVPPKMTSFPSCCIFFFGKNDFEVEKTIKAPPFCWVDKQTLSMKALHARTGFQGFGFWIYSAPLGLGQLPRCWLLPAFLKVFRFPGVPDPPKHEKYNNPRCTDDYTPEI